MQFTRLVTFPVLAIACWWTSSANGLQLVVENEFSWVDFRGNSSAESSLESIVPYEWGEDHRKWTTKLPGRGWSSPVLVDNELWMTAALEDVSSATRESDGRQRFQQVTLEALCVDRTTGKLIHEIPLFELENPPAIHTRNSFASPTPVVVGNDVVFSFGSMGTAAVERSTGAIRWKNESYEFDHETGPGSSPIAVDDRVVLNCDGTDQQFITAFRVQTGEPFWSTQRTGELHESPSMKKAFSTPILVKTKSDETVVISAGANWLYGYRLKDGEELWKVPYGGLGFSNVPRPLLLGNRLLICTGFMQARLLGFEFTDDFDHAPEERWTVERNVPTVPTPLLYGNLVFMVSDQGIASCVDARDGREYWRERLPGQYAASPMLVNDRILFCNDAGSTRWIAADTEFRELGSNELGSAIMATPLVTRDRIYIRTREALISIGPTGTHTP